MDKWEAKAKARDAKARKRQGKDMVVRGRSVLTLAIRHDALPSPNETTRGMPECCFCPRPVKPGKLKRWVHA